MVKPKSLTYFIVIPPQESKSGFNFFFLTCHEGTVSHQFLGQTAASLRHSRTITDLYHNFMYVLKRVGLLLMLIIVMIIIENQSFCTQDMRVRAQTLQTDAEWVWMLIVAIAL